MPSHLVEKPEKAESVSRTSSKADPRLVDPRQDIARPEGLAPVARHNLRQRLEVLLRKIFEGREEYLGWTPD